MRRAVFWTLAIVLAAGACAGRKEILLGDGYLAREVRLDGVKRFSKGQVLEALHLGETTWVPFTPNYPFDEGLVGLDLRRLVDLYRSYGYLEAQVTAIRSNVDEKKRKVDVTIHVREGEPVRVASVDVRWSPGHDVSDRERAAVESLVVLAPGDPFETIRLNETMGNLRQALLQRGRPLARVTGAAALDEAAHRADVSVDVDPGPFARVTRVDLEGLAQVRGDLLEPEVRFAVGQPYSPELARAVETALKGTRVFSWVAARPPTEVVDGGTVLAVRVSEAEPQSIALGVALSMENVRWQQMLTADYTHVNLFGNLTRLDLHVGAGWAEIPVPWRLDMHGPVADVEPTLTKKGFLEDYLIWTWSPSFHVDVQEGYHQWSVENRMGVARWFLNRLRLGLTYNLKWVDFFYVAPTLDQNATLLGRDYRDPYLLSYLEFQAAVYLTDNLIEPHNGMVFEVLYDLAGLGGYYDYNKIIGGFRAYWRPVRWLQIVGQARAGVILTYGKHPYAPISEKFYLGGANTVRGWGARRLSPRVEDCDPATGECESVPIGGYSMIQTNLEMRFNVWGPLSLVAFLDMGDVQAGEHTFKPSEWNLAAGPGIRYDSPVGLVRLDAGFQVNDPGVYDETFWAVHFGWGETF